MIICISGDGPYRIDGSILDQLNAVNEDLAELASELSTDGLIPT
jgi:hypothetical protein